jgi:putative Ca2+/H+ antiporter (TMEM165/GDT1 family)
MSMASFLASLSLGDLSLGDLPLALLGSTFATVFLAELGDKTQLAIVSISGTSSRPGAVFAGSSAALVLASLVGAAAGGSLSSLIPTDALQLAAAVGFLILGTRLILRSRSGEAAGASAVEPAPEPDGDSTAP